ncbi:MAG: hypothetical protein IV108_10900 [Burkholderiales bacterium]|nr:hypothetical protein [Burkholderiales bacterium]
MSEDQNEAIKAEAATVVEQGKDMRTKVRDITLRALSRRSLSLSEVGGVVRAVTEGISLGLGRRGGEVKEAAREALGGLDEALKKLAEVTRLTMQQAASQGRDFHAQDLKPALEEMKRLEETFLSTVSQVTNAAGGRIKEEFQAFVTHGKLAGTDAGRVMADTVADFNKRFFSAVKEGVRETAGAASEIKQRLGEVGSGILSGMADALHEKTRPDDDEKVH